MTKLSKNDQRLVELLIAQIREECDTQFEDIKLTTALFETVREEMPDVENEFQQTEARFKAYVLIGAAIDALYNHILDLEDHIKVLERKLARQGVV